MIDKLKPDLVFLDVQMPGMTGFDVLDEITHDPSCDFLHGIRSICDQGI